MVKEKLRPIRDYIILEVWEVDRSPSGKLLIPWVAQKNTHIGRVVSFGKDAKERFGGTLKRNMRVFYSSHVEGWLTPILPKRFGFNLIVLKPEQIVAELCE